MDQPPATTPEAAPAPAPASAPAPAPDESRPANTAGDAAPPGFRTRGRARRRARFLRKARELAYRDLGGLVFNLHRFGQRNDPLVIAKLSTLGHIDAELRSLETALRERRTVTVLREAGISACPRCAALHGGDDHFCPNCGLSVSRRADLPIAGAQSAAPEAPAPAANAAPPGSAGAAGAAAAAAAATHPPTTAMPVARPTPAPPTTAHAGGQAHARVARAAAARQPRRTARGSPAPAARAGRSRHSGLGPPPAAPTARPAPATPVARPAPAAPAPAAAPTATHVVTPSPPSGGRAPTPPPVKAPSDDDEPTEILRPPKAGA